MTSTLSRAPAASPRARVRDPYLDNARFGVMVLVVVSHTMTHLQDVPLGRAVYAWAFLFHMPVFVLVSGYAARRYDGQPRQVQRMLGSIVVPYLIVNVALNAIDAVRDGEPMDWALLNPNWLSWFLAGLFVWRLTTPIWLALRHPVLVSVAISLASGLTAPDNVLEIKRVLGFLPFYVAGMFLRREHFALLTRPVSRVVAAVVLAASFGASLVWSGGWTVSWLYYNDAYGEAPLSVGPVEGVLVRAGLLLSGFALSFAVLSLVSRRTLPVSVLGERTLFCYLVHGFVVIGLDWAGLFEHLETWGVPGVLVAGAGATVVAVLLMTKPVATVLTPVLSPSLSWLVRGRPAALER